jgi:hypothetical protein
VSTRETSWRKKLLALLEDGEWHDYVTVRDQAAGTVPPGQAFRRAERKRIASYRYRAGVSEANPRQRGGRDDTILTGQRSFVSDTFERLKRSGLIELEYGDQRFRKRPVRVRLKSQETDVSLPHYG